MVVQKKVLETAHPVNNLPEGYESVPLTFDDKVGKWVITISHPVFGECSAYEDSIIVETHTGRKKGACMVVYTKEAFFMDYDVLVPEIEEMEFEQNRKDAVQSIPDTN